jgi:hypothetical protein
MARKILDRNELIKKISGFNFMYLHIRFNQSLKAKLYQGQLEVDKHHLQSFLQLKVQWIEHSGTNVTIFKILLQKRSVKSGIIYVPNMCIYVCTQFEQNTD